MLPIGALRCKVALFDSSLFWAPARLALRQLAQPIFDVRPATALWTLVTAQARQLETANHRRRLAALERTTRPALLRVI